MSIPTFELITRNQTGISTRVKVKPFLFFPLVQTMLWKNWASLQKRLIHGFLRFLLLEEQIKIKKRNQWVRDPSSEANGELISIGTWEGRRRKIWGIATRKRTYFRWGTRCIAGPRCECTMGQDPAYTKHPSMRQNRTKGDSLKTDEGWLGSQTLQNGAAACWCYLSSSLNPQVIFFWLQVTLFWLSFFWLEFIMSFFFVK